MAYSTPPTKPNAGEEWIAWGDAADTNLRQLVTDVTAASSAITTHAQQISTLQGNTGPGSDITVKQNTDGSWPTVTTRKTGAHYRWLARYDVTKLPTSGNGAASGDELIGPDQTVLP